jgi:hypothetical protein
LADHSQTMSTGALLTHITALPSVAQLALESVSQYGMSEGWAAAAFFAYLVAVALQLRPASAPAHTGRTRLAWTLAFLLLIIHVLCAFQFVHHWSHADAYEATARQTAELTGFNSGTGLWVNYALIAVWLFDLVWWWAAPTSHRSRPRLITVSLHTFLAFIWFNATVVFGHGPIRWLGLAAWVALLFLCLRSRRPSQKSAERPR